MITFALWVGAPAHAGLYEDGVAALREGRSSDAMSLLQQAVDADPAAVEAWWELGWVKWNAEDFAGATKAWEQVATLDADHDDLNVWLGAARTRSALRSFSGTVPP